MGVLAIAVGGCGGTVDLRDAAGGAGGDRHTAGAGGSGGDGGRGGDVVVAGSGGLPQGGGGLPQGGSSVVGGGGTGGPIHFYPGPIEEAAPPEEVDHGGSLGGSDFGKLLAYDANSDGSGSSIYLTSLDASACAHRLTAPELQAKQPAFSPDGKRLAYAARSDGKYQIHVLNLESGITERVTDAPHGATAPAFADDSNRIAFITGDSDAPPPPSGTPGLYDLLVLDLKRGNQRVVLKSTEGFSSSPNERAPTFFGDEELVFTEGTSLVAISLKDFSSRDVMPSSGRIPLPRDPATAPDGVRYAYADYCGGRFWLFIGRRDGSTGDSCANATRIDTLPQLVGTAWGSFGHIAAHFNDPSHGLALIDDVELVMTEMEAPRGARNPSWGPPALELPLDCVPAGSR